MEENYIPDEEFIAGMSIDLFLSDKFMQDLIEKHGNPTFQDLQRAKVIFVNALSVLKETAPHAYFGFKNMGMNCETGHYKGSREMELVFYQKEEIYDKAEFVEKFKDELPPEVLEERLKSPKPKVKMVFPLGTGVHFWANDCYGRCSKVMLRPDGSFEEDIHGRARIMRRDPVDVLANLPQDRKNYDLIHALNDVDLMHILKNTDKFDEVILKSKTYEKLVGNLTVALNEAQTS